MLEQQETDRADMNRQATGFRTFHSHSFTPPGKVVAHVQAVVSQPEAIAYNVLKTWLWASRFLFLGSLLPAGPTCPGSQYLGGFLPSYVSREATTLPVSLPPSLPFFHTITWSIFTVSLRV